MTIRIVNVRFDSYDVYIGRAGRGEDGYFGNPFRLQAGESRGATLKRYAHYLVDRCAKDSEFRRRINSLRGKTLGCFCRPHMCHGDVIAAYLDDTAGSPSTRPTRSIVVAVVGSREFPYLVQVKERIARLSPLTTVLSGGARGVDRAAIEYAQERGLKTLVMPADWKRHGRRAGMIRNGEMAAACHEVIAFWDGRSRGTKNMIDRCRKRGLRVEVIRPEAPLPPLRPNHRLTDSQLTQADKRELRADQETEDPPACSYCVSAAAVDPRPAWHESACKPCGRQAKRWKRCVATTAMFKAGHLRTRCVTCWDLLTTPWQTQCTSCWREAQPDTPPAKYCVSCQHIALPGRSTCSNCTLVDRYLFDKASDEGIEGTCPICTDPGKTGEAPDLKGRECPSCYSLECVRVTPPVPDRQPKKES